MNAAIEKGSQEESMQEKDAESRRFLKETAQNYTVAPWEIGQAGQEVMVLHPGENLAVQVCLQHI